MFQKCPFYPDAVTVSPMGRRMDCPKQDCRFNDGGTCIIIQSASLARENYEMLRKLIHRD